MGPGNFGRYALVTSLYLWLVWGSDLSLLPSHGAICPTFHASRREGEKLQKFFSNLLAVSLLSGALCACLYLLFTSLWLTDLDLILLITMSATLLFRAAGHPFFTLFLGLNQAARWGMGEILRHWFILVLVIIGFYLASLQGAFLGLLLTELIVLSIGVWWGKPYLSWTELRLDMRYLSPLSPIRSYLSHFQPALLPPSNAAERYWFDYSIPIMCRWDILGLRITCISQSLWPFHNLLSLLLLS